MKTINFRPYLLPCCSELFQGLIAHYFLQRVGKSVSNWINQSQNQWLHWTFNISDVKLLKLLLQLSFGLDVELNKTVLWSEFYCERRQSKLKIILMFFCNKQRQFWNRYKDWAVNFWKVKDIQDLVGSSFHTYITVILVNGKSNIRVPI